MPVLVTQADTPLGTALVQRLLATGGQVRAYCSAAGDVGRMRQLGAIAASGDVDDVGRLEAASEQVHTVIHLGGGILHPRPEQVLVDMQSVVEAAGNAGVRRLVFLSVLGASPSAAEPYRRLQGLAEAVAAEGDVPSVAVRLPLVATPALAGTLVGTPLPSGLPDAHVQVVSSEAVLDLLVELDELRSSGDRGHATLVAPGREVRLGDWIEHLQQDPAVVATYRPLSEVPMLADALGAPWVDDDPVPANAWEFTGIDPGTGRVEA